MSIPFLCVFLAFLLNYASKIPVGVGMARLGYDNRHPRDQQTRLQGWARRAHAAHLNSFEIFPAFGIAVVMAHLAVVNLAWMNALSIAFVVSRVVYIAFYVGDVHYLRSAAWFVGAISTGALFVLALI